jgi:hypothetical protein
VNIPPLPSVARKSQPCELRQQQPRSLRVEQRLRHHRGRRAVTAKLPLSPGSAFVPIERFAWLIASAIAARDDGKMVREGARRRRVHGLLSPCSQKARGSCYLPDLRTSTSTGAIPIVGAAIRTTYGPGLARACVLVFRSVIDAAI